MAARALSASSPVVLHRQRDSLVLQGFPHERYVRRPCTAFSITFTFCSSFWLNSITS